MPLWTSGQWLAKHFTCTSFFRLVVVVVVVVIVVVDCRLEPSRESSRLKSQVDSSQESARVLESNWELSQSSWDSSQILTPFKSTPFPTWVELTQIESRVESIRVESNFELSRFESRVESWLELTLLKFSQKSTPVEGQVN